MIKIVAKQKGFTLVETLVAITILLIVITGPLTISTSTARSTTFASEQVTAFFLAQEGAELAQMARDNLLLEAFEDPSDAYDIADAWADFTGTHVDDPGDPFDPPTDPYVYCYDSSGCRLELESTDAEGDLKTVHQCGYASWGGGIYSCSLYFDVSQERNRYIYPTKYDLGKAYMWNSPSGSESTSFQREIFFEDQVDQVKVTSRVSWQASNVRQVQQVEVVTYLFNIYE